MPKIKMVEANGGRAQGKAEGEGMEVLSELSDVLYKAYTKGA